MTAVLPSKDIGEAPAQEYFLPYQREYILGEFRMGLSEKSVRIGWTYADAFRNVRRRLLHANRDYLFGTKDWPTALEYMQTCQKFIELYNRVRSVVSRGEMSIKVPALDDQGKKTGFDEEVKIGYIKFDNGSRILAFTSNPAAMQAYGGDVGLDEFAKHKSQELLYATAQGRVTWGYDCSIWSAHWGDNNLFYDFALEAREGAGPWDWHRKITMEIAVEQGLVEKINEVTGSTLTRPEFLADCRKRARSDDVYEQEYNCEPRGGTAAIVPWATIVKCRQPITIERVHLEHAEVIQHFGEYQEWTRMRRQQSIQDFILGRFAATISDVQRYRLGFDVAASGQGDLASLYIDRKATSALTLAALFTCRTDDWHFLKTVLWAFLSLLSDIRGCGDETGLGRQICWETAKKFPGSFEPVNFRSEKHDMGFTLMSQLQEATKILPEDVEHNDIAQDFYAMKKEFKGGKWVFSEGKNTFNPASHCDIAWSGGLASRAAQDDSGPFHFSPLGTSRRDRRDTFLNSRTR